MTIPDKPKTCFSCRFSVGQYVLMCRLADEFVEAREVCGYYERESGADEPE